LGFVTERNTTVPLRVVSHDAVPDLTDRGYHRGHDRVVIIKRHRHWDD
jgi:hypothetical protein